MDTYLLVAFAGHFGEGEVVGKFVDRDVDVAVPSAVHGDAIVRVCRVEPHYGCGTEVAHAEEKVVLRLVEGEEHGLQFGGTGIAFAFCQLMVGWRLIVGPWATVSGTSVAAVADCADHEERYGGGGQEEHEYQPTDKGREVGHR